MDAIPAAVSALLNAIQGVTQAQPAAAAPPLPALLALAGQDVAMLLLGQAPGGGLNLALPSGQVVTAQGQLPYPDGTQLLMRVLPGNGTDAALRLQTLLATPPAAPAILAPLLQGEAAQLQASLAQPDPPPGLADLAELFQLLAPKTPPDPARLQEAVDTLTPPSLAALKTVLELPQEASQATVATALDAWLAGGGAPAGTRQGPAQASGADLLQRFQASVDRHPEVPPAQGGPLVQWLKQVLGAESRAAEPQAAPQTAPALALQQQLSGRNGAPPELPATWEAWITTSIKTLNDPSVSPQGAPFHAAQAKEGTAFYEIPLPWAPQHPLQMWVESDRNPKDSRNQPDSQRVLLGLSFSNLGETRLGIARNGANLQVRVWTEHPELLEASQSAVEAELQDLGGSVDLKIMALSAGPGGAIPSLRSQVTGPTLEALG
jgi:hypothetical protein